MEPQLDLLDAAREGDEVAFRDLVHPHRRGLLAHCYRMSGSIQEAEDLTQEALLRAWRGLDGFEQRSSFRNWLYRIATHATLDALKRDRRRMLPPAKGAPSRPDEPLAPPEPLWLEPYPDQLLPDDAPGADVLVSQRQSIGFAFLQALQRLPASQRAALLLKDVLGLSAAEVAELLDTSVAATNSLLQRARDTLGRSPPPDDTDDDTTRQLLSRYVAAWESANVDGLVELLRDDARLSMPPVPSWYRGPEAIVAFLGHAVLPKEAAGLFRVRATRSNGVPAIALYQRDEESDTFRLIGVQALVTRSGMIDEIVAFMEPPLFRFFDLPEVLPT